MYKTIKQFFDRLLAGLGLLLIAVPLFFVALIIKIDSKGPAIFKQIRTGKDGKPFVMYKFRTMKTTEVMFDINNPVVESTNDNLTRVGGILRRLKIDELPQLFNVLKGEMSLIGPRPFLPIYLDQYEDWEFQRLKVVPGMTGLAQLNGNGYLKNTDRSYYDIYYVYNLSLINDIKILVKTVLILLFGEKKFYKDVDSNSFEKLKTEIKANKEEALRYKSIVIENAKNTNI